MYMYRVVVSTSTMYMCLSVIGLLRVTSTVLIGISSLSLLKVLLIMSQLGLPGFNSGYKGGRQISQTFILVH